MYRFYICIFACFFACDAYNILVFFPFPGKSHAILGEGFIRNLLEAGHNITYISPTPAKIQDYQFRYIDSACENLLPKEFFNIDQRLNKSRRSKETISTAMHKVYDCTLNIEAVQGLMSDPDEKFDAVIVEWMFNELASGLATVFECPLIWVSSLTAHTMALSLVDDHLNPAYTFIPHSKTRSFTLSNRIYQLYTLSTYVYERWSLTKSSEESYQSIFEPILVRGGRKLPSYNEVRYNASFMFGNGNLITSDAIQLPRNYKDIGGFHIQDQKPLPQDFKTIMDKSDKGVIYFSFGSILPVKTMSEEMKAKFLDIFSNLNQTVIWKSDVEIANLSKNVHVVKWAPQQSILGHPNCILFITHGGLLSITEAVYHGVPVIGMPFFADQFNNIEKAALTGFGKRFDLAENSLDDLEGVINEVLENPSYRNRAKEVSAIYHHRLTSPGEELVYWVEHVIRTRGALHLKSYSLNVEWYEKMFLDLLGILLLTIVSVAAVIKVITSQVGVVRKNKKND